MICPVCGYGVTEALLHLMCVRRRSAELRAASQRLRQKAREVRERTGALRDGRENGDLAYDDGSFRSRDSSASSVSGTTGFSR
jgi:hypothetical protein